MTDSLLSTQILSRICSFCSTKELGRLAITSKALSVPAIQILWHALPSFVPLVYTLPPDAWNVRYYFITERTFTLTRPLIPADFARLRIYAPLVKIIAEPPYIPVRSVLSPPIWDSFRDHGIGSLFNLYFAHYVSLSTLSDEPQQFADPIHNFIGPSLVNFHLILQGGKNYEDAIQDPEGLPEAIEDQVLLDILVHLSHRCPQLRNFELETTPFPFYAANALSDAVCRWSHLRSFEAYTCPLGPEAWKHLAALPSLHLLDAFVDLPTRVLEGVLLPGPQDPLVFPALRELTLHAKRLETCTRLLEIIESTTLAKLSLYTYDHARPEDIESLCDALAAHVSHTAIQDLLIQPGCTIHDPPPSSPPTGTPEPPVVASAEPARRPRVGAQPHPHAPLPQSVLAPLLALRSLQELSLLGPCFSALDDATLAAIAHALPALFAATLCPDAAHRLVTLPGLGALARMRDLRSIQVPLADVDAHVVADAFVRQSIDPDPAAINNTSQRSTSHLRCIAVGRAKLAGDCVEGAAAALSAWFPRLQAANFTLDLDSAEPVLRAMGFAGADDAFEARRRWLEVGDLVCSFAFVREQERRWAAEHPAPREGS